MENFTSSYKSLHVKLVFKISVKQSRPGALSVKIAEVYMHFYMGNRCFDGNDYRNDDYKFGKFRFKYF